MTGLSVIIPALNEETEIAPAVRSSIGAGAAEVLVVDGGSVDGTASQAKEAGARVLSGPRGRGNQIALGVASSAGEAILILHADTRLPREAGAEVRRILEQPGFGGGAFTLRFREPSWTLAMVAAGINLRSRLGFPCTGDQAQFFRRVDLLQAGGIPEVPLFEDLVVWRRIRRRVRLEVSALEVETSGRRLLAAGPLRTVLAMWRLRLLHRLGVSPARLARSYGVARSPGGRSGGFL